MDIIKKIKREKSNKKWSPTEIISILNYLEQADNIEQPTAQIFYKKMIAKTGINATWDLIRWKVRYLKTTYRKANDWRNSTGAGLLECDAGIESVDAKISQMCPHYHQLAKIFGEKNRSQIEYEIIDTGETCEMNESFISFNTEETLDGTNIDLNEETYSSNVSVGSQNRDFESISEISVNEAPKTNTKNVSTEIPKKAVEFAEKMTKFAPKSSSAYLAAFQAERTSLFKMKFEWERQTREEEVEISRKKVTIEEEKTKAEIELKKQELELKAREIERDERLRILEMEKDERLRRYEIEMKYKYQNKQP